MLTHDIRTEITDLIIEFAWRIDHDAGHDVDELFTADGRYVLFGHPIEGRDDIRAMYDHRRSRGARTSRHIFDNVRITPDDRNDDVVHVSSVLTLHAGDGEPPLPLAPLLIADYTDTVVRDADGRWRFANRDTTLLFQPSRH